MEEKKSKLIGNPVDRPLHYTSHPSGIEAIVFCEQMSFCIGNAFKYLYRLDKKWDSLEDCKKAIWYIDRQRFTDGTLSHTEVCSTSVWNWDRATVNNSAASKGVCTLDIDKAIGSHPSDIDKAMYYLWCYRHKADLWVEHPLAKAKAYIQRELVRREQELRQGDPTPFTALTP
jgi:hypothetical protein